MLQPPFPSITLQSLLTDNEKHSSWEKLLSAHILCQEVWWKKSNRTTLQVMVTTSVSPATCAAAVVTFVLVPPALWFAAHDLLTASLKVSVPRTAVSMPSATAINFILFTKIPLLYFLQNLNRMTTQQHTHNQLLYCWFKGRRWLER